MNKVAKKFVTTILIIIGAIVLYVILVMGTTDSYRRTAPAWTGLALIGGIYGIIHVWSTGWTDKSKSKEADKDKSDMLKL